MTTFAAVLDANVLIQAAPRDTLLRAADAGLYRPLWTREILEEVERNLVEHRLTDLTAARRLVNLLDAVFPEATVTDYERYIDKLTNDPKDRHVLAAAIRASAQIIVTENLSDFPHPALEPHNIEARSIDQFLTYLFWISPATMVRLIAEQAADLENPPMSILQVIAQIARSAPTFSRLITERF